LEKNSSVSSTLPKTILTSPPSLPAFVAEIRRIFSVDEIRNFLDELERTKYLAPTEPEPDLDDADDPNEEEPWLQNPVLAAKELLPFARIRQLLQA
jgi:hypothetical protein